MGADLSAEYDQRDDQFAQRYRERFGESVNREDLLEQYRSEKLKLDQQKRYEELQRQRENERSKSDDEQYYRRKQEENYKIMKQSYDRNRESGDYHRRRGESDRHRSHRSRRHRDHDYRRRSSRGRHSSRDRSRSRRSSSRSSDEKENRRRGSSKKTRSDSRSTADEKDRASSKKSERVSEDSRGKSRKDSSRRSSDKIKKDSSSDDEKPKSKSASSSKKEQNPQSQKSKTVQGEAKKKKKKKKRQTDVSAYQSAPDLTAMDRQYGRGPWQRAHEYFDRYEQRPQSWIQELSRDRSATLPTPVMERQIVYGLPSTLPRAVDGLGYPLKQQNAGFQPVPYQTYLMQQSTRHGSMELYNTSRTTVPHKSYEVQAHLPAKRESSLPSKFVRSQSESTSIPPTYKTPPVYGAPNASEKSVTPTPKPRNKSPSKDVIVRKEKAKKASSSTKHALHRKTKPSKITATTAREDLEFLLASDYEMTRVKSNGEFSNEFPPVFPQTFRANQEIYVDDVVFRQHPKIRELSQSDSDSSDMMTDEEHVLTLGEDFSPNSVGYSSGYDLEIPEGFKFDSSEKNSVQGENQRSIKPKSAALLESAKKQKQKKDDRKKAKAQHRDVQSSKGTQTGARTRVSAAPRPLVLTSIQPVTRSSRKSSSPERKVLKERQQKRNESPKRKAQPQKHSKSNDARERGADGTKPRDKISRSTSPSPKRQSKARKQSLPERQTEPKIIYSTKATTQHVVPKGRREKPSKEEEPSKRAKRKNKRIQHPPKDDSYLRIITPSLHWVEKPAPKKTHDVGVGTKPSSPQKSIGVQTPKSKQPPAQPIYFLKPLSAHEVFIDDNTITSQSETDLSQAPTSSVISSNSTAKSGTSWSKSSTQSSGLDYTDPSEVGSVVQNFQRNSQLYASGHKHKAPTVTSEETYELDSDSHPVGPSSMMLGVSESIQASSYEGREGKVFCLTRSRAGSSPPGTLHRERKSKHGTKEVNQTTVEDQQIEPTIDTSILARNADDLKEEQQEMHPNEEQDQDVMYFNPTKVGKWVLDCYVQDHRLTALEQQNSAIKQQAAMENHENAQVNHFEDIQSSHTMLPQSAPHPGTAESNPPDAPPPVPNLVPLTTESLAAHQVKDAWPKRRNAESETDASLDIASDVGMFQKELIKTKHKMWKKMHKDSLSPDPAEQYKHRLKQWNDSPTANVVLAECQAVTDLDSTHGSIRSPKHAIKITSHRKDFAPPQPPFSSGYQSGSSAPDHNSTLRTEPQPSSASSAEEPSQNPGGGHTERLKPAPGPVNHLTRVSPNGHGDVHQKERTGADSQDALNKKSMQNIDKFLDDLDHGRASRVQANPVHQPNGRLPTLVAPEEDWRVVSPRGSLTSSQTKRLAAGGVKMDMNENVKRLEEPRGRDPRKPDPAWMRRSMDSLMTTTASHHDKRASEDLHAYASKARNASLTSDTASCPSPVANPFRKMDKDDITTYVENFPGRGSVMEIQSEKQLLKSLEQARERAKKESLEERTARILGIHRKALSSSSSEDELEEDVSSENDDKARPHPGVPQHDGRKDLNAYMNNLLTGVTDVSPGSREKYYAKQSSNVISPMAANPQNSTQGYMGNAAESLDQKKAEQSEDAESAGSDTATMTESFSVNVSDSVLEASIDCKVMNDGRKDHGAPQAPPAEYKIPENVTPHKNGTGSSNSQGNMLMSYTRNIYADTPGFHKKQQSFDTTESEGDTDLDASYSMSLSNKMPAGQSNMLHRPRVQESPVPVASNSAPLTERELEIVRELCDQNSTPKASSSDGSEGMAAVEKKLPSNLALNQRRFSSDSKGSPKSTRSRSPSRELAKDKIARSIGFKLHTPTNSPARVLSPEHSSRRSSTDSKDEQLIELVDYGEYDIKILSADRRNGSHEGSLDGTRRQNLQQLGKMMRVTSDDQWTNEIQPSRPQSLRNIGHAVAEPNPYMHGSPEDVKNAMESVGLDPTDAWLLSV